MSGSGSRKKKEDENNGAGIGGKILMGAAVAGLAATAAYGLFRLLSSNEEEEEESVSKKLEDESKFAAAKPKPVSTNQAPNNAASSSSMPEKSDLDELLQKYNKDVYLDERHLTPLRRNAEEIQLSFSENLKNLHVTSGIEFDQLIKCGWGRDFFVIKSLQQFAFLVPLKIDEKLFIKKQSGNKSFKLISDDERLKPLTIKEGLLTPSSIAEYLLTNVKQYIESSLKKRNMALSGLYISDGCIFIKGANLDLMANETKIKLIPAIKIDEQYLVPFENENQDIWKLSFINEESKFLEQFSPLSSCHKVLYSSFVDISLTWKDYFAVLNTEQLKHISFHLIKEQPFEIDWDMETCFEHFIDFLMELRVFLSRKNLPNVFDADINMFSNLKEEPRKRLLKFIEEIISKKNWKKLITSK